MSTNKASEHPYGSTVISGVTGDGNRLCGIDSSFPIKPPSVPVPGAPSVIPGTIGVAGVATRDMVDAPQKPSSIAQLVDDFLSKLAETVSDKVAAKVEAKITEHVDAELKRVADDAASLAVTAYDEAATDLFNKGMELNATEPGAYGEAPAFYEESIAADKAHEPGEKHPLMTPQLFLDVSISNVFRFHANDTDESGCSWVPVDSLSKIKLHFRCDDRVFPVSLTVTRNDAVCWQEHELSYTELQRTLRLIVLGIMHADS